MNSTIPLLSFYSQRIVGLVKCSARQAVQVEALMRNDYQTLDGLSAEVFAQHARCCLEDVKKMGDVDATEIAEAMGFKVPAFGLAGVA